MATIQERIKDLRIEKNYTQEELAKLLGLNSKSNIANYENGANSPSDKIKLKLCEIFDCSLDYLMGTSNYKNEYEYIKTHEQALSMFYGNKLNNDDKIIINDILNKIRINKILDADTNGFIENEVNKTDSKIKNILILLIHKLHGKYCPLECENEINCFENNIEENTKEFKFAYHKEAEGLTDEEISDALRFYKEMKKRVQGDNK